MLNPVRANYTSKPLLHLCQLNANFSESNILALKPYELHFVLISHTNLFTIMFQFSFFSIFLANYKILFNHIFKLRQIVIPKEFQAIANAVVNKSEVVQIAVPSHVLLTQ